MCASILRADADDFAQKTLAMEDPKEPLEAAAAEPRSRWSRVPRWAWVSASGPVVYALFYVVWRLA